MSNYVLPRMHKLSCLNQKCNGVMEYRDHGWKNPANGYYCTVCGRADLDCEYKDIDQMSDWQKDRIVITKDGELL